MNLWMFTNRFPEYPQSANSTIRHHGDPNMAKGTTTQQILDTILVVPISCQLYRNKSK